MNREDSNVPFHLPSSQTSLDSEISNHNDDETSVVSSSRSFENKCTSKIIQVLGLDQGSIDWEIIARQLMINGRQALQDRKNEISKKVFDKQLNVSSSELLQVLKTYVEQQWRETIHEEWFHQFLLQQASRSPAVYDQILTRTAEYGLKYMKDNVLLSLVIQFLFEFDDETIDKDDLFDKIWNALINEGRRGIQHYQEYISANLLKEQLENNQSPLYLALIEYYRQPLRTLFKHQGVNIHNAEILETALHSVADCGWLGGLHDAKVTESIARKKFNKLIEKLKEYLTSQGLAIPDESSFSNNNQSTTPVLINTSSPVQTIVISSNVSDVIDKSEAISSTMSSTIDHQSSPTINVDDIRRQERIQECKLIKMCVNEYEKLQLSNLIEAGELMYIDQKLDHVLDKIIEDYCLKKNFSSFIHACLIPIMYLLKRHQNLDDFMESLFFKYSQIEPSLAGPKLTHRMITHILLLNSDLSLSRKIMSLLSKRNPVPFLQPSLSNDITSYQFVSDIIHVWDYSNPTLLSFGIGPAYGKSTLINTIFLSSFEQSTPSIYFQNTIDIDFGYSFLPRRSTNIADSHGSMMISILKQIYKLFDGFLIHVEYSYLVNNIDSIFEQLNVILKTNSYRLLIIRDVPINEHGQCSVLLSSKFPSIETFLLPNVADQNNKQNKHFILTLRDRIWDKIPTRRRQDMSFLKYKLKDLMDNKYKQYLYQMYKIIVPLKRTLLQTAIDGSSVKQCFPEYLKFVELCELKLKLARFNFYGNENDTIVYDVRQKVFELKNSLDTKDIPDPSIIYKLFSNVLKASSMLTCLELLTDELKQERTYIVSTADMAKQLPIQKSLSLEVLWRNAIVCSQRESEDIQKYFQQQYYQYIQAGFPFEIVDGDNFHFPYSFLFNTLEPFRNRRTLVISIIGPQNSGKSTLLNYMFGTLFDVRDGRCTRGIYGSFVKTNQSDFEYIMLIDTEGLLSIEREDSEYDRRIVLFCLAVSHLVIVNMVGEVSTTLQSMLTLCTDSLEKMGVTKIPQPIVHFILNQKADLNIDNHQAAIDRIISDLKRFGLGDSIDIRKETFHTLPSAFKKEGQTLTSNSKLPNVVKTAPEFIERVQLLSGEIIRSAQPCLYRSNEFFDPLQWLSSSRTIFDTLQKFSDLTYYRDIHERRLDNEIREHIRNDLTKTFSADYRNELILQSSHKTEQEINDLFLVKQNQIQESAREKMEDLFKLLKVPDTLRQRSEQFLKVQITEMFNALRTSTIALNEREKVKSIVQNGEGDLEKLIDEIIQSGQQMLSNVASEKFEQMFDNTIRSIKKRFVSNERLQQAINHIYTNYNIYEKECLFDYGYITHHLPLLSNLNDSQATIAQVEDELIMHFTKLGYQHSSVTAHHFNPTTHFSLDIIKSLIYLNKDLLEGDFVQYLNQSSPSINKHQRKDGDRYQNKNFVQRSVNYMFSAVRGTKDDKQLQQLSAVDTDQFQLVVRDAIRNQKPTAVRNAFLDDRHMYFGTSKVFKEVIVRILKTMKGEGNDQVRQIRTELIQKIVGLVNSLTIEIDNELAPFCLSLSRQLKSTFHTCAMILLTKYYYNEQRNYFIQTLSELETKKNDLKKYFISMVVPNASVDENYSINLAKQFKDHLIKLFTDEGQKIINAELKSYDCLNRKWIQDRCDGQLLTHTDAQWHLDYIENPTKIIEQFFKELWGNIQQAINQKLTDRKSHYIALLNEFFFCIQGMLNTVSKLGAAARFVKDIFISKETNSLDANENLINKKRCMAILLHKFFSTRTIPTSFCHMETYSLKSEALNAFQLLLQQRTPSTELSKIMQETSSIYDKISIGNFAVFLQTLLNEKEKILDDFNRTKSDFKSIDTQDTYARLLDKVRGCPDLCPCCKRPCDVDHTQLKSTPGSQYNEHRCLSGHTLRAMNGYKFEITEEASLLMCEQIKDDHVVVIGPTRYQWLQFKKDHPDWIFDSALDETELSRLHGKFLTVWQKIGPKLCQKFGIKYVTHNTPQKIIHEAFHYILLLDASGSMRGERWTNLMEAVQEFLKRRQALKTDDRISIIIFSDQVETPFLDVEIKDVNIKKLKFLGGYTSFSSAFANVDTCIACCKRQLVLNSVHENVAIVFMSDGEDLYPEQELNQILMAHNTVIKRFWTLALGDKQSSSMDVLEQINEKMNGSFYDIATSTDLIRAYAEVAISTTSKTNI